MELELKPTIWWRVIGPNGEVLCETSDENEARKKLRSIDRLRRLYRYTIYEWRTENNDKQIR